MLKIPSSALNLLYGSNASLLGEVLTEDPVTMQSSYIESELLTFSCRVERTNKTAQNQPHQPYGGTQYNVNNYWLSCSIDVPIVGGSVVVVNGRRYVCDEPYKTNSQIEVSLIEMNM